MSAGSSVRQLTDVAMAQAEVSPTTVVEARNIATAGGIIAAGLGVSAFPELVLPLMSSTQHRDAPAHRADDVPRHRRHHTRRHRALAPRAALRRTAPRQLLLTAAIQDAVPSVNRACSVCVEPSLSKSTTLVDGPRSLSPHAVERVDHLTQVARPVARARA